MGVGLRFVYSFSPFFVSSGTKEMGFAQLTPRLRRFGQIPGNRKRQSKLSKLMSSARVINSLEDPANFKLPSKAEGNGKISYQNGKPLLANKSISFLVFDKTLF